MNFYKKLLFQTFLSFLISFSTLQVNAQPEKDLITDYLKKNQVEKKLQPADIEDWVITDNYTDKKSRLTHIYIQQRYHHIVIFNAISGFVIKENKIVNFTSGIIDRIESKINTDQPAINSISAIGFALKHLNKPMPDDLNLKHQDDELNKFTFESTISESPINVQLVYRKQGEKLILAWDVSIEMKDEPHWWNIRVDASNGNFIDKNDFTQHCLLTVPDYNIFPFPIEAPTFGNRSLLTDPSDPTNSPYGWHDVDGVTGEEYTITRGNNVYAYEDADNNNQPGYSPDGGVNLHFDFPYAFNAPPQSNEDAALTNLFYCNNRIHDYLYHFGFTEEAGNFQGNNYNNGGLANDFVKAEGLDGSGTNNANFSTPSDGLTPRMQMYLWDGHTPPCNSLNVNSSTFNGSMITGNASFTGTDTVTANLILVNDGTGTVTDACTAIQNNISGKIVLIDRGTCNFNLKAQNAENAGAVGVIIANNASGGAITLTGSGNLSIPVLSVSQADGNTLKAALNAGGVTITMSACANNAIDASFDNGIITHEYGHGVSNRLTGGPSQSSCLSNAEQGGEGWSDWFALMMTIESGDQGTDPRGMATFSVGDPPNGSGIRRFPYSTNMSVNPQTYASLAANPEVHAIGEIWCDVLWDMSWFLINQYGFSVNPDDAAAGNNIAMNLVIEGMKLQPCNPGYLDARDAIMTAEALLYNNVHRCLLWQAFSRRGMGFNAVQGSAYSATDQTAGFNMPPFCLPATQTPIAAFSPDMSTVLCGKSVKFNDQSTQAFDWHWDFGDQTTSNLQNPSHTFTKSGTYDVKLIVTNPLGTDSVTHSINVTSAFSVNVSATPTFICSGDAVTVNAVATGSTFRNYSVTQVPYTPVSGNGTTVTLTDDSVSSAKPIGFTFNFFGIDYTNFYISSNGLITFSPNQPPRPVYGVPIPTSPLPNNLIALAWNDLFPPASGSNISYFNTGSAPNRKLIVKYNTFHYGGASYPFVVQGILYEGTNEIEIHTTTISDASTFDDEATTTQGVENADGVAGIAVPGRNGQIFSASNDAYKFVQYIPYSFTWQGNLNGATQVINPTSSGTYNVTVSDGSACVETFATPYIEVNPNCNEFILRAFLEGYYEGDNRLRACLYNGGLNGDSTVSDTLTVELYDQNSLNAPLTSVKTLLHTNGRAICAFPQQYLNSDFYLAVQQRNSIKTWSSSPVRIAGNNFYDFTSAQSQAYGNNMTDVGAPRGESSKWAFYSGDISDPNSGVGHQDGIVESQDYSDLENAVYQTLTGYRFEDLTGDNVVESEDYSIMENNVYFTIVVMRP